MCSRFVYTNWATQIIQKLILQYSFIHIHKCTCVYVHACQHAVCANLQHSEGAQLNFSVTYSHTYQTTERGASTRPATANLLSAKNLDTLRGFT